MAHFIICGTDCEFDDRRYMEWVPPGRNLALAGGAIDFGNRMGTMVIE
jgi:hypothetical protein